MLWKMCSKYEPGAARGVIFYPSTIDNKLSKLRAITFDSHYFIAFKAEILEKSTNKM